MSKQFVSRVSLLVLLSLATFSHVALASSTGGPTFATPVAQDDEPTGTDPEPINPGLVQILLTILSIA
jgi:hypothetical protein